MRMLTQDTISYLKENSKWTEMIQKWWLTQQLWQIIILVFKEHVCDPKLMAYDIYLWTPEPSQSRRTPREHPWTNLKLLEHIWDRLK